MYGFSDRRPVAPVAKAELRSKASLGDHLLSHHAHAGGSADFSHSELREIHQEHHAGDFYIQPIPHEHGGVHVNREYADARHAD